MIHIGYGFHLVGDRFSELQHSGTPCSRHVKERIWIRSSVPGKQIILCHFMWSGFLDKAGWVILKNLYFPLLHVQIYIGSHCSVLLYFHEISPQILSSLSISFFKMYTGVIIMHHIPIIWNKMLLNIWWLCCQQNINACQNLVC